nr:MAG TPA: hypothetical protein [Caudoviricetes sp.]
MLFDFLSVFGFRYNLTHTNLFLFFLYFFQFYLEMF